MDFANYNYAANADRGAVFVPLGPDGKPLADVEFDVIGSDSGTVRKLLSRAKVDAVLAAKKAKQDRGAGELTDAELTEAMQDADARKEAMELAVAIEVVKSWRGVKDGGADVDIKDKAAFIAKYDWLVPQIVAFVDNRANFMKAANVS